MNLRLASFLVVPALAFGFASAAQAQSQPAQDVHTAAHNVKEDVKEVAHNVKLDAKDTVHGNFRAAHQRHMRVIRGAHRRHVDTVRSDHRRHMSAAQCLARYGRTNCVNRGYAYGHRRHMCRTAGGHWVRCARR